MIMKKYLFVSAFVFLSLILSGCAALNPNPRITSLNSVWNDGKYPVNYLDTVLLVGKPQVEANRSVFEAGFAEALYKRNIAVIPSYTVIPDMKNLNRESVRKAAKEAGVKNVLVAKVVSVEEKEVIFNQTQENHFTVTPRGTYMTTYTFAEPRKEMQTQVRIETGLFDVETEALIWAATSDTMNPDSANEAIKDFSKAIIKQLVKDGYVKPGILPNS
jgi:hypothetical protein